MIRIVLASASFALVLGSIGCAADTTEPPPATEQGVTSTEPTEEAGEQESVGLEIDRNKLAEKPKQPSLFEENRLKEVQPYVEKKP